MPNGPDLHRRDRVTGCLLGGALGDALGGTCENQPIPILPAQDAVLALSDDTQLTIATCEAIVAAQAASPERIAAAFAALFRQRRIRGLGASTFKALQELAAGAHWALAGSKGERSAGNGPATRIAPLAFVLDPSDAAARQTIRDICRITHHNDEAYCGAVAVLGAIRQAITGNWSGGTGLLHKVASILPDCAVRDRLVEMSLSYAELSLNEMARRYGTSGYVVESVPFALAASERLNELGFRSLVEAVIQAGGDTDSIASIVGQVCGTCVGQRAIPKDWLNRLREREHLLSAVRSFCEYLEAHRF